MAQPAITDLKAWPVRQPQDKLAWTVIRVEDRQAYLKALEAASVGGGDIRPFAAFIAQRVRWSIEQAA